MPQVNDFSWINIYIFIVFLFSIFLFIFHFFMNFNFASFRFFAIFKQYFLF